MSLPLFFIKEKKEIKVETKLTARDYGILEETPPYKSYIKTVLGRVRVIILSPFSGEPEEVILTGNPKGRDRETCIIDVYSSKEDMYFKKVNSVHFKNGEIIEHTRVNHPVEPTDEDLANSLSDEEMKKLLHSKFFSLQSVVNKMTSVAPVFRMIELARDEDASERYVKYLEGRLAELQEAEYAEFETVEVQ